MATAITAVAKLVLANVVVGIDVSGKHDRELGEPGEKPARETRGTAFSNPHMNKKSKNPSFL